MARLLGGLLDEELRRTEIVTHLAVSRGVDVSWMSRSRPDVSPLEPTARSSLSTGPGPSLRSLTIAGETPKFLASDCWVRADEYEYEEE